MLLVYLNGAFIVNFVIEWFVLSSPSVCVYWVLLLWGKVQYPKRSVSTTNSIT